MERDFVLSFLMENAFVFQMTGSRYICDPPPKDTDEDYIALMSKLSMERLADFGFILNTNEAMYEAMPDFFSWRRGEFNVICVLDEGMYIRWVDATEQAKSKNLTEKSDRIALFQWVLYGNSVMLSPF